MILTTCPRSSVLNLTLKIGFLFASWIELFVNIALQHLKTLWWYCPNLNQDSVWPHPKSPFSPQNLMSPQCNWTLGMLCCDECNWILRCFRKERKDLKGSSGDPTTRELDPQNLISPGWTSQLVGVVVGGLQLQNQLRGKSRGSTWARNSTFMSLSLTYINEWSVKQLWTPCISGK